MSKFKGLGLPVDEPARMTIIHPTTRRVLKDANGTEAYLEMLSPDSTKAIQFEQAINNKRLSRRAGATAEDIDIELVDRLIAVSTGWYLVDLEGEPIDVPFTPAAARELLSANAMRWLRDQAFAFWSDRANFAKASSTI